MEEEKKIKINWQSIILQVVITFLLTGVLSQLINYLALEDLRVNVSDSTLIANEYYTSFSISNFKNSSIEDASIYINDDIVVLGIEGDSRITENGNSVIINEIPPKGKISCIIKTKGKIEEGSVMSDGTVKIGILHFDKKQYSIILIETACIYAIMFGIYGYITQKSDNKKYEKRIKRQNKIDKEYDDRMNKLNKEVDRLLSDNENNALDIKNLKINYSKTRIYYLIRISDLKNELDFWRNTIRKMMYSSADKFKPAEVVIEMVTNELKTYTTNERNKDSIDEMFYLANIISEKENK